MSLGILRGQAIRDVMRQWHMAPLRDEVMRPPSGQFCYSHQRGTGITRQYPASYGTVLGSLAGLLGGQEGYKQSVANFKPPTHRGAFTPLNRVEPAGSRSVKAVDTSTVIKLGASCMALCNERMSRV
ncbi:uncharacterized protein ColSpa_11808 [Colletotrichum spaethianum]|uniref:Uncharacterized protein n=1 Tax=Colletotrichum spaethianum TaxID=700344 RepID=A0AA37PGB3_9PEZI|nr:uncharacterized protein ColSpa_11808 [Colletotrichum spaethianum]GKT51627.1 hypothetical protein ColSpa_11808 [Colletotrichum spaethianum]